MVKYACHTMRVIITHMTLDVCMQVYRCNHWKNVSFFLSNFFLHNLKFSQNEDFFLEFTDIHYSADLKKVNFRKKSKKRQNFVTKFSLFSQCNATRYNNTPSMQLHSDMHAVHKLYISFLYFGTHKMS